MDSATQENGQNSFNIVVTAPSSPETHFQTSQAMRASLETPNISSHSDMTAVADEAISISLAKRHLLVSPAQHESRFDDLLAKSDFPEPGLAYFQARRALWLTPMPSESPRLSKPLKPSLRTLLEGPTEALYEERNWDGGVGRICERILSGEPLANQLSLQSLIKLLQAHWVVNNLWPKGRTVPSSDEETQAQERQPSLTAAQKPNDT